jgi:hypothetical protein
MIDSFFCSFRKNQISQCEFCVVQKVSSLTKCAIGSKLIVNNKTKHDLLYREVWFFKILSVIIFLFIYWILFCTNDMSKDKFTEYISCINTVLKCLGTQIQWSIKYEFSL